MIIEVRWVHIYILPLYFGLYTFKESLNKVGDPGGHIMYGLSLRCVKRPFLGGIR
jgi:hypothetical protein